MKSAAAMRDRAESEWTFWALASTFLWIAVLWLLRTFLLTDGIVRTISFLIYPVACVNSARLLFKRKRRFNVAFGVLNLASAVGWLVFVIWLSVVFSLHPWR